jgi:hypothetical protein
MVEKGRSAMHRPSFLPLFTEVRGRGILRTSLAGSCMAPVLLCQDHPAAPVLRIEVNTASCGAEFIYTFVNEVGAYPRYISHC